MLKLTLPVEGSISLSGQTTWIHFGDKRISLDYLDTLARFLMNEWTGEYKTLLLEEENDGVTIEIGGHDSALHGRKYLDPGIILLGGHNSGCYVQSVNGLCRDYSAMQRGEYARYNGRQS